jgi:hypothetical protein
MSLSVTSPAQTSELPIDLAGKCPPRPNFFQCQNRIHSLSDQLLSIESLNQRIEDLGHQFQAPKPRVWKSIQWQNISTGQILGVDAHLYCKILAKSAEIELPSRGYSITSRAYLGAFHPPMARFMGGIRGPQGQLAESGVWEKEEQTHGPILRKLYKLLMGEEPDLNPTSLWGYHPQGDLEQDAYNHMIFRMTHEYMAVAGYIMLLALSTGELQQTLHQITRDEVSHCAKFFGFIRWQFGDSFFSQFYGMVRHTVRLTLHHTQERNMFRDFGVWNGDIVKMYLLYEWSKLIALQKLWSWSRQLDTSYLNTSLGNEGFISPAK